MARSAISKVTIRKTGNFSVEGLNQFYDNVERVLDRTSAENLKGVFMKAGMVLRDRAKANAPFRTGKLRNAIFAAPGNPDKPNVLVGVSRSKRKTGAPPAPHGILIEYGTSKMQARPFFRPAITETKGQMAEIIITGFKKTIEDAVK